MKKILTLSAMALFAISVWAENLKTVVFTPEPQMTCQNCEKKIKSNIRFVKGTKSIETSLDDNTVTITYDADKATVADYEKAFEKIGRDVTVKDDNEPACQHGCSCCEKKDCK